MSSEATRAKGLTGRHVLITFVMVFGVVFAVNITFVVLSLKTFTGEDVPDAYSRGLAYNEIIEERAAQAALGWTAAFGIASAQNGGTMVTLNLADADGAAISGAEVIIMFRRSTHDGEDMQVSLAERAPGSYVGDVELPGSGTWDARGQITRGEDERLDFEDRLWVE